VWGFSTQQGGMIAPRKIRGIGDKTCRNRIQMNICKKLLIVLLSSNQPGFVSTLPEAPQKPMSAIESSSNPTLDPSHASPKGNLTGLDHDMVVRMHQTECQDFETVKSFHIFDGINEMLSFPGVFKDLLTARNSAVNVVDASWNEQSG